MVAILGVSVALFFGELKRHGVDCLWRRRADAGQQPRLKFRGTAVLEVIAQDTMRPVSQDLGRLSLPILAPPSIAPIAPPAAPERVRRERRLIDSHGRTIRDLRISITDRCNFRCVYCMEPDVRFAPPQDLMSVEQIVRIARVAERLGVRKIRITGGEPTVHPELDEILARIGESTDVELALITNGVGLEPSRLRRWKAAGLDRVTISIDSLQPERFTRLTRSKATPQDILDGIEHVIAAGLTPLKLNAVLIRGINDDEAADLAELALRFDLEMRFIEYMPLDSGHAWNPALVVSAEETRRAIERRFPLVATGEDAPGSTAKTYRFANGRPGRIGFIAPISSPFCGACSRLRITADAKVRPCLFSTSEWDARPLLARDASDEELEDFLIDATWTKQAGHGVSTSEFRQPDRPMSAIGG